MGGTASYTISGGFACGAPFRERQAHFRDIFTLTLHVPFANVYADGFEIRIYNLSNVLVKVITSSASLPGLVEGSFVYDEHGCGDFSLKVPWDLLQYFGHGYRVDIHPFLDINPWYSGYVTAFPLAAGSRELHEVRGRGFWTLLERVRVNRTFTSTLVHAAVKQVLLLDVIPAIPRIVYNGGKGIQDSIYTLASQQVNYQKASEVLDNWAAMAGDAVNGPYLVGINGWRQPTFKPNVQNILWHKFFGHHFQSLKLSEDSEPLINRLIVKTAEKDAVTGAFTYVTVNDTAGQASLGEIRADIETAPSTLLPADATMYAQARLALRKVQEKHYSSPEMNVRGAAAVPVPEKIEVYGRMRITDTSGTDYDLPIRRVTYNISSQRGIWAKVEVGAKSPTLTQQQAELLTKLAREEQLQAAAWQQ